VSQRWQAPAVQSLTTSDTGLGSAKPLICGAGMIEVWIDDDTLAFEVTIQTGGAPTAQAVTIPLSAGQHYTLIEWDGSPLYVDVISAAGTTPKACYVASSGALQRSTPSCGV
jgi:hypothetical protein